MKVLAVGGERSYVMGLLKEKFSRYGLDFVAHWDYNYQTPDDIPIGTEGVVCFKDMMSHGTFNKAKLLAGKQGLPFVAIPRKEALAIKVLQDARFITLVPLLPGVAPASPPPASEATLLRMLEQVVGSIASTQSLLGSGTLSLSSGTVPMPKPVQSKPPTCEEWLPLIVESNPFLSVRETLEKLATEVPGLDLDSPVYREAAFEAKVADFDKNNPTPPWTKTATMAKSMQTRNLLTTVERAREWYRNLGPAYRGVLTQALTSGDFSNTVNGTRITAQEIIAPLLGKPQEIVTVMLLSIPDKFYSLTEFHAAYTLLCSKQLGPYYLDAATLMVGRGVKPRMTPNFETGAVVTPPAAVPAPVVTPEAVKAPAWESRLAGVEEGLITNGLKANKLDQSVGMLGSSVRELGGILTAVREAVAGLSAPQAPTTPPGESEEGKKRVDALTGMVDALDSRLAGLATRVGTVEMSFSRLHAQVDADKNHALELLEGITPHLVAAKEREEMLIKRIEALEARGSVSNVTVAGGADTRAPAPLPSGGDRSPELTLRYLVEQGYGFTVVPPPPKLG